MADVLSQRRPSDGAQANHLTPSQLLQKIAPRAPKVQDQLQDQSHALIIQHSLDTNTQDATDKPLVQEVSANSHVSKASSNVGRAWVADAAGGDATKATQLKGVQKSYKVSGVLFESHSVHYW